MVAVIILTVMIVITLMFVLDQVYLVGSQIWQSQNPKMRKSLLHNFLEHQKSSPFLWKYECV